MNILGRLGFVMLIVVITDAALPELEFTTRQIFWWILAVFYIILGGIDFDSIQKQKN